MIPACMGIGSCSCARARARAHAHAHTRASHMHMILDVRERLIAASVPRRGLAGRVSQKMEVKGGLNPQGPPQPRDQVPLFCASHTLPPAAPLVVVREPAHLSRRRREVEVGEPAHQRRFVDCPYGYMQPLALGLGQAFRGTQRPVQRQNLTTIV